MTRSAPWSSRMGRSAIAVLAAMIAAAGMAAGQSQPLLQITSPSDGAVVSAGQPLSVVATPAPGANFTAAALIGENPIGFSQLATAAPFQFSVTIPANIRVGQYFLTALAATAAGQEIYSDPIAIDVERSDTPIKLAAEPGQILFESQGEQIPLRIKGTFSDGTVTDLTESSDVAYTSSNTAVATVTSTGVVTAVAEGTASISAKYGQASQTLQVSVAITVPTPPVSLSAQAFNFSGQDVGTSSSPQSITITNTGNSPLSIKNVATTGSFTETDNCVSSSPIASQGTCTINVTFFSTANGTQNGSLDITTSLSVIPLSIPLTGVGVGAAVTLSASSLTFDSLASGGNGPQTVTVTNSGSAPLVVSGVTSAQAFPETDNCVYGSPISPGSECLITVNFVPGTAGIQMGSLTISDNVTGSPQVVNLAGVSAGRPSLAGRIVSRSLSGGTLTVGLQLTNSGAIEAENIEISQFGLRTLSGSDSAAYSGVLPFSVGNLAPGASVSLTFTFTVPSTVLKFSVTENGTMQDGSGTTYNYSIGQVVYP